MDKVTKVLKKQMNKLKTNKSEAHDFSIKEKAIAF